MNYIPYAVPFIPMLIIWFSDFIGQSLVLLPVRVEATGGALQEPWVTTGVQLASPSDGRPKTPEMVHFFSLWPHLPLQHSSCPLKVNKQTNKQTKTSFLVSLQKGANRQNKICSLYFELLLLTLYIVSASSINHHCFSKPPLSAKRAITHPSPGMRGLWDAYHDGDCSPPCQTCYVVFE